MFNELPDFRKTKYSYAMMFINGVLMGAGGASLVRLEEFDDHHFRAVFKPTYFQLAEGVDSPTKSQWGTLKKRMKRRNHSIFIFREYGQIACDQEDKKTKQQCLFIDFGFLED